MLAATLASMAVALFTGAAVYVNVAEQPARLALDDGQMLTQWQLSYRRAAVMQGSLALVGTAMGLAAGYRYGDWRWLVPALLMFVNWPYTLLCVKPTNDALHRLASSTAGPDARRLVARWGWLHAVRSALGVAALGGCLWAAS